MRAAASTRAPVLRNAGPTPGLLIELNLSPRTFWLGWAVLLLLANLCVLQAPSIVLRAVGGILLFGILPGSALIGALFRADEVNTLERVSFGLGTSIILSTLASWLYSMAPGRMTAGGLVTILDVVSVSLAAFAVMRWRRDASSIQICVPIWTAAAIGLIALTALISFLWLDYSEFEGDEIVVAADASAMVMGDKTAIYHLAKGPAQTLLVAQFELYGATLHEGFLRVPFAAEGVAAACAWLLLSRKVLGRWLALIALLWFALDGLLMSKSRIIQFPVLIYLMSFLAVYALIMAYRVSGDALRFRYQLLASAFAGFGLFSHYTMAFVAPALIAIWLAGEAHTLGRLPTWLRAASMAAVTLLIGVLFYWLLFTQASAAGKVGSYYLGYRIGQGPFNSIPSFGTLMRLYESPPWFVAVAAGVVACAIIVTYRAWRRQPPVGLLLAAAFAGMLISVLFPNAGVLGGYNLSFVPWALLGVALCLTRTITSVSRSLALWALCAFFVPIFWMQVPGDHFNSFNPPLILLSLLGLRALLGSAMRAWPLLTHPVARAAVAASGAIMVLAGAGYLFVMIVSHAPEYATLYPGQLPQPLAWFAGDAPETKFGTPHNNGWRAVAVLYDQGTLRGEYQTNEFVPISEWYRAVSWHPLAPQPRYYFVVVHPQVPLLASDVPADLPQTHVLWGQVTVDGEPRILIYQRREGASIPASRTYSAEAYDAAWRDLARIERFVAYRERHRDDTAFYSLAHFLESDARDSDAIVFDDSLGRGLLSQFYRTDRPYLSSTDGAAISPFRRVWGVYWASPDRKIEQALAVNACPALSQWFGNVRLALNGVGTYAAPVVMNVRLGDAARLESYALPDVPVHAGDVLCVRLDWSVVAPTAERLKLFIHLVTSDGKLTAQTDTEPQAGFKLTTEWHSGERFADRVGIALPAQIAPGRYRLLCGLYDAQSGVRESAYAANGTQYPDDAVQLGTVTLQ